MSTLGIVQGSASSPAAGPNRSRSWRQLGRSLRTRLFVGLDVSGADWFKTASSGKLGDSESLVEDFHSDDLLAKVYGPDAATGMSFSFPIRDDAGKTVGVWTNRLTGRSSKASSTT